MPTIYQNLQSLNAGRSYPIEESAPKLDDNGRKLPNDLLISARLCLPDTLVDSTSHWDLRASLCGLSVGPGIVTATFVACLADGTEPIPLASVSVPQPVIPGKPYMVNGMASGVSGWVAFGSGVSTGLPMASWRFTDPLACLIIPRQVYVYAQPPVTSVSKNETVTRLRGYIQLRSAGGLIIEPGVREIDGLDRACLVFRLDLATYRDALSTFAGNCGRLPEAGTSVSRPIKKIGDAAPDATGDIQFVTSDDESTSDVFTIVSSGEIAIDCTVSQEDVCNDIRGSNSPASDGTLPGSGRDTCNG